MPPKRITLKGQILEKLEKHSIDGLTIKEFKKDKNINYIEKIIQETLKELVNDGKVSETFEKRENDFRTNMVYRLIA